MILPMILICVVMSFVVCLTIAAAVWTLIEEKE
jgi:hypothetical protein